MKPVIIDVRERTEFMRGHVEGAINIPPTELIGGTNKLDHLPKNTPLVLYCVSGSRSNASMHFFREMGFNDLTNGINKDQVIAKYNL